MNIDELIIPDTITVMDAMQRLNATARRNVFIAPQGKLQAVVADGDTRRYILEGGDLSSPVRAAANYNPKSLPVERRSEAHDLLLRFGIDALPLLDKDGCIVDIVFLNKADEVDHRTLLHSPVVVMAGGKGTRLYPYTKILPKPLIPVGEVPILELIIDRFHDYGCTDFSVVVNYKKNMIKSYFSEIEHDYSIRYVEEDTPLGTGGGLGLLRGQLKETFFFTNCDILIDADYADILRFHKQRNNDVTMVCATKQFVIPYGVVSLSEDGQYGGSDEKPNMNYLINTGLYVVEPGVLEHIEPGVAQGFPDIIDKCRQNGLRVGVYPVGEGSWMDMGQLEELEEMRRRMEGP